MTVRVILGDCLQKIPALVQDGLVVDAVVCDPPYGLNFMSKAWDDSIAFRPETWAVMLPVLRPGGYLLAFGGSRTHHRMWCAIEDAGFVIQDEILWLNGQGFPKGRSQLKPAHELICVAYKPGGKRTLQIDECRVLANRADIDRASVPQPTFNSPTGKIYNMKTGKGRNGDTHDMSAGRWPANVCHDGSAEVMEAFAAFGDRRSSRGGGNRVSGESVFGLGADGGQSEQYFDTGTAARFYYCAKASKADRAGSKHPTCKPVALMRWLVRLVTPPGGKVLDPFAGSGTTGAAALAEGRRAILIERELDYFEDIKMRLSACVEHAA